MIDVSTKLSMMQERFKSSAEKEYAKALGDALNNVMAKIQNTQDDAMRRRLVVIRSLIEKEIGSITKQVIPFFQDDIQGFAELSHATMFKALNVSTGAGYAFAAMPASTIKEIINMERVDLYDNKGYTMADLFKTEEVAQINRYKQIINAGLAGNSGYAEIGRRLKQANETGMDNIKAIVRTSISSARDLADGKAFDSFDDVITGWKSVAVLDSKVSLLCGSMDSVRYMRGKVDKFGKMITDYWSIDNRPPRHINCRSRLTPLTHFSDGMDGTRSKNGDNKGQIDSKITFPKWFDKQSEKFQRDYLGKARYDLYKSGKFTINSFIDVKDGTRFTLAELKGGVGDLVPSIKQFSVKDLVGFTDKELANMVNERKDRYPILEGHPITKAIMNWSQDEYIDVRRYYRGESNNANEGTINGLKDLFNMGGNFKGKMYRGLSIEDMEVSRIIDNLKELDDFTDVAPTSWTTVQDIAHEFANINNMDTKSFVLEMESKSNLAYDVHSMSTFMDEGELILKPSSKIRVKSISYSIIEDEKIKVITLEEY